MQKVCFALLALCGGALLASAQRAEDYKVTALPGIDITSLNFTQYAGHIEISPENNANIFFWMIEREETIETEKLIIWLNGGPGCSSMDGLFLENGPFRVNKNLTLSVNSGGWQNYATNIYVDQPVGTGFSFANTDSYMHNMDQITEEFVSFIDKLLETFPQLKTQDLYIAGESYAGTYIPYFTARLLELNRQKKKQDQYNLQGIAIGNGWISAQHQYNAYYDFSVAMSLVDQDRMPIMSQHLKTCQDDMRKKETIHLNSCERILSDIVDASTHDDNQGRQRCINLYDIRSKEEPSPECGLSWPYELSDVTNYLRQPEVKMAVHADKQILGWKECTSLVTVELHGDESQPAYYLLPGILEEIPVLLYSGEYDLICNYIGTEYLISNMTWNGSRGFGKETPKKDWKIDNRLVGYYTQERNLTYVLIKDGSHMVPYDRPIECLDMINRFMQVGSDVVKGLKSQVGDLVVSKPSSPPPKEPEDDDHTDKEVVTEPAADGENEEGKDSVLTEDKWRKYYSWGTTTLIFVLLFAITLCCCWCRGDKRPSGSASAEFGGAPQRQREDLRRKPKNVFGFIKNLFKSSKPDERRKFRLGDNDESNELDELVIETPTLFEAEHSDQEEEIATSSNNNRADIRNNQQSSSNNTNRFAIDGDETDDDFEDFADFDDGEGLTNTGSGNKKFRKRD